MKKNGQISTLKFSIIFLFVFLISGSTLFIGYQPIIIVINPTYTSLDKPLLIGGKMRNNLKLVRLEDRRPTDVVDTFYSQVNPPLHWIIRKNGINVLSEALRTELEFYGFETTLNKADYYLFGQIMEISLNVVQQYPEIVEATIRINLVLKNSESKEIEWNKLITGKSSTVGRCGLAVSENKAINKSMNNFIQKLISDKSFNNSLS